MRWVMLGLCSFGLAACDLVPQWAGGDRPRAGIEAAVPESAPEAVDPVEETDLPPDESAKADPAPANEVSTGTIGRTVASLGNAAEPGLWLKTPLVSVEQPGRVYYPETNATADVTLIPIDGPDTAGSRLSLAAMQALGAPLTGLPEVDVFGA